MHAATEVHLRSSSSPSLQHLSQLVTPSFSKHLTPLVTRAPRASACFFHPNLYLWHSLKIIPLSLSIHNSFGILSNMVLKKETQHLY